MNNEKHPIKHVQFSMSDYYQPPVNGGGKQTPLKEVTSEFRSELLESLDVVEDSLTQSIKSNNIGVCTAVVALESNATAKSHRPTSLFNEQTCPFFGDEGFGRYLIQVTKGGLSELKKKVETVKTKSGVKALSTIKEIEVYHPKISKVADTREPLIIRLFRYQDNSLNKAIDAKFEDLLSVHANFWVKHPSQNVCLYKVQDYDDGFVAKLSEFSTVQSAVKAQNITVQPMSEDSVESEHVLNNDPLPDTSYPIVGVVDSGVSQNCSPLNSWVIDRHNYVPEQYRDNSHGTFVSGLISNPTYFNPDDRFPKCQSKVISVEVLGNGIGDVFDIVHAMYEVASQRPEIKVWNLSLGASEPTSMQEISAMALMLDEFQDKFDCLCVIAAGNYNELLRKWPPEREHNDGVSSPGDSVRAITVGSLAQVDGHVKNEDPSPFSRKGPVSNFVQKPELMHFGGNVMVFAGNSIPLGVNSICPNGFKRHDIGTSFSTPLVSTIAANLFHKLGDSASPNLVKALMIHDANINFGHKVTKESRPYMGWGLPTDADSILEVNGYEATIVFEGHAQKSFEVQKLPFPIPDCLRTKEGKVRAEFFITLVYQPELDSKSAFEYCQVDVTLGLGEIKEGKFDSKIPRQQDSSNFESELVKNGDKWSPTKVYHKRFTKGVDVEDWKLRVKILDRDGYEAEDVQVPFTILLTIRDIDKEKPVYNEMSRLMDQYNWEVSDLAIEEQIKVQ